MDKIIESTIKKLETVAIDPHPTLNPTLGIIYRANDAAAGSYLHSIERNAEKYKSTTISAQCDTIQNASLQIRRWSQDPNINGIILISDYGEATQSLYNMIPMRLDIDGLSNKSAAHLYGSKDPIAYRKAPCTAAACLKIIQTLYDNNLAGLNVAVVGRSLFRAPRSRRSVQCRRLRCQRQSFRQFYDTPWCDRTQGRFRAGFRLRLHFRTQGTGNFPSRAAQRNGRHPADDYW